jgi:sodium/pantothenate symporter
MNGINMDVLIPLILYFVLIYAIGLYSLRFVSKARSREGKGFLVEFLTGDRNLGGFVLAMTLVATYLSAGSFIGGPGTAYTFGLAWVFLAMSQMPTGYFTLAVVGKKLAIVARKINAVTVTDLLKERYESTWVVVLCSIAIVFFFTAAMTAQWIGAARLIEGSVGISYTAALTFFAITVLIYTTIGGFRAVALTDTLQGVIMTIGTIAVIIAAVVAGGGVPNLVQSMAAIDPGLISPFGTNPQFTSMAWVTSFWILVGFAVVGMPQVAVRAMSYRDTKSLKRAIIYGTFVSMILLLGMHLLGAFGRVLVPEIASGDLVVPTVTTKLFPNWIAGIIVAGPLAAVMSTVDSQLLLAVGAIVNDIYVNLINPAIKRTATFAFVSTLFIGLAVFIWALDPPDLLVWLNLYAHAGIIATFLWPLILGIYWKRANAWGALASIVSGVGTYIWFNMVWQRPFGMHTIVLPLVISLAAFLVTSLLTEKPPERIIAKFWGV